MFFMVIDLEPPACGEQPIISQTEELPIKEDYSPIIQASKSNLKENCTKNVNFKFCC